MEVTHLSRHFLGIQAHKVRWVPFATPGPPDQESSVLAHKLFAVGGWDETAQQNRLSILDLQVRIAQQSGAQEPAIVEQPAVQQLATWEHAGRVTDLQVADLGGGEVVLLAGSARGCVSRLQLAVPRAPGSRPEEVQLRSADQFDERRLKPWLSDLHSGRVASVDVFPETQEVLTAGADGAIFIVPMSASQAPPAFRRPDAWVSYRAARWSSLNTFVTAGTTGGLETWDKRRGAQPVACSPREWGLTGCPQLDALKGVERRINCLDVHPSRPHLCATGAAGGTVTVWDLRFNATPLLVSLQDQGNGDIWEVALNAADAYADLSANPSPSVLFCSDDGILAAASPGQDAAAEPLLNQHSRLNSMQNGHAGKPAAGVQHAGNNRYSGAVDACSETRAIVLHKENAAMNSYDVEPLEGRDVLCVTDQECMVYLRRTANDESMMS